VVSHNNTHLSGGGCGQGRADLRNLLPGDCFLMQVASPVPNHAAVYLGDGLILHHLQGRLSSRDVYGGYWQKVTTHVLRYGHGHSSR
jgi:cell wall-associated NlpC family hydrolase